MDEQTKKSLLTAKIFYTLLIFPIPIYAIIFVILKNIVGLDPIFNSGTINIVSTVLIFVGIVSIIIGYNTQKLLIYAYQRGIISKHSFSQQLFQNCAYKGMCFEAVAIYGLILGILGANWLIIIPFWVVSAATLIHTFPTEEKWKKILIIINQYDYLSK